MPLSFIPTLQKVPNIAWSKQTLEQLIAERDWWKAQLKLAKGFASTNQINIYIQACEKWIRIRQNENDRKATHDPI